MDHIPPPLIQNFPPGPPLRPETPDTTPSIRTTPLPETGQPSPQLKQLCESISRGAPSTHSKLTPSRLIRWPGNLERLLKNASHSNNVTEHRCDFAALLDRLEHHEGPVIVLGPDPDRRPQFVFEQRDGRWQGYQGLGFRPLEEARSSPLAWLKALPIGTTFKAAYTLDGWKPRDDPGADPPTPPPIVIQLDRDLEQTP